MRLKKWIRGTLSVAIGCMAAFPCFSCGGDNGPKDTVITESEKITMTEFSQPVSLLPLYVESYLAADPQDLVTSYVVGGNRLDKGAPVTIEYSFKDIGSSTILEEKLEISSAEDFSTIEQTLYFAPRRSSVNIYNLQTDTTYFYRVTVVLDNGETHVKTSSLQTQDTIRFIALDGACNVRDIGGWQTQSGKTIKSGLLYRGSEIDGGKNTGHADFCLTEKGITQLRALGIKTDFDLRSSENKVSEHSILGEDVARTFYNAPQYQFYFNNSNKETTRKIFSDLAKPEAYPVYLHCTHGVDRAGSTVLLLESLLGVAKEDLIRDYELSAFYYAHVNRNTLNGGGSVTLMLEKLETFEGETLADKTENFLLSVGVTQAEIDTIRSIFLG